MRVLQQTALTGPQAMRLITDVPVPAPGTGEVLVRVGAAGVNFADVMQTRGTYVGGPRAPYVAGFEAAGEGVALGPGVTGLAPGDRARRAPARPGRGGRDRAGPGGRGRGRAGRGAHGGALRRDRDRHRVARQ